MEAIGGIFGIGSSDPTAKLKIFDAAKDSYGPDHKSTIETIENERKIYADAKDYLNGDGAGSYKQKSNDLAAEKTAKQSQMEETAKSIIAKVSALSDTAGRELKIKQDEENISKTAAKKKIANEISSLARNIRTTAETEKNQVKSMLKNKLGIKWSMPEQYKTYSTAYDAIDKCVNDIEGMVRNINDKVDLDSATKLLDQIYKQASLLVSDTLNETNYKYLLENYAAAGNGLYKQFKSKEEYAKTGQVEGPDKDFNMSRLTSSSSAIGGDGSITFSYTFLIIAVVLILIMLFLHFYLRKKGSKNYTRYPEVVEYC
jgi:hypothetical protein